MGFKLRELPSDLKREIDNISKLRYFEEEFKEFLHSNGLPSIDQNRSDGWIHFVYLYARVVEGCPLVISPKKNSRAIIEKVTVHLELAKHPVENEMFFKVTWTVSDKNGLTGDIFIINSFSVRPE